MLEFPDRAAMERGAGLPTSDASITPVSMVSGSVAPTTFPHFKQNLLAAGSSASQAGQCVMGKRPRKNIVGRQRTRMNADQIRAIGVHPRSSAAEFGFTN